MSETNKITTEHSLKTLAKVVVGRLENLKFIEFNPAKRGDIREDLFKLMSKVMLTDQAITQKIRDEITSRSSQIEDVNITETDAFQMRKRQLKAQYADNQIAGFFLKESLRDIVAKIGDFFMTSSLVEEVFGSDEEVQKTIKDLISNFDESKVS